MLPWKSTTLSVAILLFLISTSSAQDDGFGLGIIIGEPTGITAKKWLTETKAVDFSAAWSFEGNHSFVFHGDMVSHKYDLIEVPSGEMPLYYGAGYRLRFSDKKSSLGARFPVGLNYHLHNSQLGAFFELAPVLELIPSTKFKIDAALGFRYFFK